MDNYCLETPEICSMMNLSTAHLKPDTLNSLEQRSYPIVSYAKPVLHDPSDSYGVFVCASAVDMEDEVMSVIPSELKNILAYAVEHDISWAMFDADAPVCEAFETFFDDWANLAFA